MSVHQLKLHSLYYDHEIFHKMSYTSKVEGGGGKIIVLFFWVRNLWGGGYGEAVGLSLQICPELYVEHSRISTMEFFCEKS